MSSILPCISSASFGQPELQFVPLTDQTHELRVALAEVASLKSGRAVLQRRAGVLYLADSTVVRKALEDSVADVDASMTSILHPEEIQGN